MKRLFELVDIGHVGKDAQLDLAIVGRDELAAFLRDKGGADQSGLRLVRTGIFCRLGSEEARPPCRGRGHGVGGMDAFCMGIDEGRQGIGIGAFELGETAPVEHGAHQLPARSSGISSLIREVFKDACPGAEGTGFGFLAAGQRHAHL